MFFVNNRTIIWYTIDETIDAIKANVLEYVNGLNIKREYNLKEIHHIVARRDLRALLSQIILKKAGIDINDPRNLVAVDKCYHKVLHTNTYYLILNTSISLGYGLNGEEGVETVLYVYRVIL